LTKFALLFRNIRGLTLPLLASYCCRGDVKGFKLPKSIPRPLLDRPRLQFAAPAVKAFSLIELLVVVAIVGVLASLLLPTLGRAKQEGQRIGCASNLRQIGVALSLYLADAADHFPDRRDLKTTLPGGYHPWPGSIWPPSDPRAGWAMVVLGSFGAAPSLWSCAAAARSPVGNALASIQVGSMETNAPASRYWTWRFDRTNDMSQPVMLEDFWGKSSTQAIADLISANDSLLGPIKGPVDVVLTEDPYFPKTAPTVDPPLKGRTIHPGTGRNRLCLDGHAQFYKDPRTPLF